MVFFGQNFDRASAQPLYRTQNANNACMSYKNEVKMYSSSQPQGSRLDSPNISMGLSVWPNFIIPQGDIYIKEDYSWLAQELHFKHVLGPWQTHWPLNSNYVSISTLCYLVYPGLIMLNNTLLVILTVLFISL